MTVRKPARGSPRRSRGHPLRNTAAASTSARVDSSHAARRRVTVAVRSREAGRRRSKSPRASGGTSARRSRARRRSPPVCDQRRRAAPSVRPVNDARTSWGSGSSRSRTDARRTTGSTTTRDATMNRPPVDRRAPNTKAASDSSSAHWASSRSRTPLSRTSSCGAPRRVHWSTHAAGQAGLQALTAASPDAALARQEALDQRRLAHARRAFDEHEAGPLTRGERGQFRGSPGEHLGVR